MLYRIFCLLVCSVMLSGIAFPGGGQPNKAKAIEAALKPLEGKWQIITAELGGKPVESNDWVEFSGGKCTITNPGTGIVMENTISLDPSRTPKHMDITNIKTKESWVGIYELKVDQLRAVFQGDKNGKRPTEFKTREGSQEVMYTYKRVKPK